MLIITYRNVFFALTATLVIGAIAALGAFGLNVGTDFTGGSLVEVRYSGERPDAAALQGALAEAGLEDIAVRGAGDNAYIVRAAPFSAEARAAVPEAVTLGGAFEPVIERLADVGPSVGSELRNKALIALALVLSAILLFIAFVFRKVSKPVSSWVYGLLAILSLAFTTLTLLGFYALLGRLTGAQIDTLFVTALLTMLAYAVHDNIVVFDRVRENLRLNEENRRAEDFELVAGRSLEQTFVRSMTTSFSTAIALVALFLIGPVATQDFALTLIVGIVAGTFASIALATPLLVTVAKWQGKA